MDDSNKPGLSLKTNDENSVLRTISFILGLAIIYFGLFTAIAVGRGWFVPSLLVWVGAIFLGLIFIVLGREKGLIVKIDNKRLKIGIYKNYKENVKPNIVGIIASLFTFFAELWFF